MRKDEKKQREYQELKQEPLSERERAYLYWLCQNPALGAVKIRKLWDLYHSFEKLYNIEGNRLEQMGAMTGREAAVFESEKSKYEYYKKEYFSLAERGARFITPFDEEYPQRLTHIHACPMGLTVRGRLPVQERPSAAIIGARACTGYGSQMARTIGKLLAQHGVQIISGLAAGIDGAGHRGALDAGGATFGILGCGVQICYPKEHYHLYREVEQSGGLISEYGMAREPKPYHFPMRNRLISGLADVVLVIEARERSGSLITAELALEQGKDVFALPGRITDPVSAGCNQLIEAGAGILTSPERVLEYLGLSRDKMLIVHEKNTKGLAKEEKMVYSCLDSEPKFLEQIMKESGLSVGRCMSALLELEMRGLIVQISNHYYGRRL